MIASVPQFSKPHARHSSKELGRRLARRVGLSLLAVTIFVVSAAGFAWHNIQSRIAWFNIDSLLTEEDRPGTKPPDSYEGRAVNLLILGTDSRAGNNNVDGSQGSEDVASARSDTALVMHISADRKRVDAVSIPRDTLVDIPECKTLDGEKTESSEDTPFNSAFAKGAGDSDDKKAVASGATCTWKTVEKLTGLTVDHFVQIGMGAVPDMVDAVGGVELCYDNDADDQYSGLKWTAGCHTVDGTTALQFSRMRYQDPEGDIGRTKRQRQVISKVISSAASPSTLVNPAKTLRVERAGSRSFTVDEDSSVLTVASLVWALRSASSNQMMGVPPIESLNFTTNAGASAVLLRDTTADDFFAKLRSGTLTTSDLNQVDGL